MLGTSKKTKDAMDLLAMTSLISDDPLHSFIFIYGVEGSSTTTLSYSIVDAIPKDKKLYVVLTEPPHNATAPLLKHFPQYVVDERVVLPSKNGVVYPIINRQQFQHYMAQISQQNDVGAVLFDALDSLRFILYNHHLNPSGKNTLKAWGDADNDIINVGMIGLVGLPIPKIIIMKEKDETKVGKDDNGRVKFEKTGHRVPAFDSEKIQRWASMRFRTLGIGEYEVMKTKGMVKKGEKFTFGFDLKKKPIGDWLPELLRKMKVKSPTNEPNKAQD